MVCKNKWPSGWTSYWFYHNPKLLAKTTRLWSRRSRICRRPILASTLKTSQSTKLSYLFFMKYRRSSIPATSLKSMLHAGVGLCELGGLSLPGSKILEASLCRTLALPSTCPKIVSDASARFPHLYRFGGDAYSGFACCSDWCRCGWVSGWWYSWVWSIAKNFIESFFKNIGTGLVKHEGLRLNEQVHFSLLHSLCTSSFIPCFY